MFFISAGNVEISRRPFHLKLEGVNEAVEEDLVRECWCAETQDDSSAWKLTGGAHRFLDGSWMVAISEMTSASRQVPTRSKRRQIPGTFRGHAHKSRKARRVPVAVVAARAFMTLCSLG